MEQIQEHVAKVIIIAGFLGSGKTTLVEAIIKAPELSAKVAVIQNEFSADMGIENMLIRTRTAMILTTFTRCRMAVSAAPRRMT